MPVQDQPTDFLKRSFFILQQLSFDVAHHEVQPAIQPNRCRHCHQTLPVAGEKDHNRSCPRTRLRLFTILRCKSMRHPPEGFCASSRSRAQQSGKRKVTGILSVPTSPHPNPTVPPCTIPHHRSPGPGTFDRRDLLKVGSLSISASVLPGLANDAAATPVHEPTGKAKSVIYLWMGGGVTHIDSFDPKPEAPEQIRGTLSTISTSLSRRTIL